MYKLIIFGGTTEGRILHDFARENGIPALTCVATGYGESQLYGGAVRAGRLEADGMKALFSGEKPSLVIDATHPYADNAGRNIRAACDETGLSYLRVARDGTDCENCYQTMDELIGRLKTANGTIFAALGAKEARKLTVLPDYQERLWLRVLPSTDSLGECLALGYPAKHVICMQGPFTRELNAAMFRYTGAKILATKESGDAGGFSAKIDAARELEMDIYILGRPRDADGVSLMLAKERMLSL